MSKQYPGGIISKTAPTLNPALGNAAPGIWTLDQVAYAVKTNTWPAYDPYYKNVTLNLHGNGTNAAQNNTFLDSSTNNFTITRNGNTTQGTYSPYGANWSNYFDGTTDFLTAPANAAFGFGTGDFTAECWVYPVSWVGLYDGFISTLNSGTAVGIHLSRDGVEVNGVATAWGTTLSLNTWTHLALTRSGTTLRLFVNGALTNSGTNSANIGSSSAFAVGRRIEDVSNYYCNAYISNARIVKGTAVYTSAFTPSTTPLTTISGTSILTCADNRFIDDSTNNFAITKNGDVSVQRFSPFSPTSAYSTSVIGGSGYFDGTGDYLALPANSCLVGANDFTLESWVYVPDRAAEYVVFNSQSNATTAAGSSYGYGINTNGTLYTYFYVGSSTYNITSTGTVPINAWSHVALVRTGGTVSLFINGVRDGTRSDISTLSINAGATNYPPCIGINTIYYIFKGYISNLRLLVGSGGYNATSSTITIPTAPLTAVTNTSVLLNYTNAGILDNAMMNNLETVGNAQISTSVKKYGTGSISFDGTGDKLYVPNFVVNQLGTGDYTIEFWVYANSWSNTPVLLEYGRAVSGSSAGLEFYISTTGGKLDVYGGASTATLLASYSSISATTWTYVALTRASGTTRLFINGTQSGSSATDTTNYNQATINVGAYVDSTLSLNGYIDDLRITKGVARYTANFTAPTSQLQDQ